MVNVSYPIVEDTQEQSGSKEPLFYFIDPRPSSMPIALPFIPDAQKDRPTFIIMLPDRVYRLEKMKNEEGNAYMVLIPCQGIISSYPTTIILQPDRFAPKRQ